MEKKRSARMTVLGWFFIVVGIFFFLYHTMSCFAMRPFQFPLLIIPFGKTVPIVIADTFIAIYFLLFIFAGWGVINLNNLCRKLIILLLFIPLIYIFTIFNPWKMACGIHGRIDEIPRKYPLSTRASFALRILTINLVISLPFLILIYFFTRPKVKEQFK